LARSFPRPAGAGRGPVNFFAWGSAAGRARIQSTRSDDRYWLDGSSEVHNRLMQVLETIEVSAHDPCVIELCLGDLTSMPIEHAVDVLVVSAFPDDYIPTPSSLIGALWRKGVAVADLAKEKDVDLRDAFSCWLSHELVNLPEGLPYKRLLCFEPASRGTPPSLVGDVFRALAPFLAGPPPLRSVAMPILAAGDQRYSLQAMLFPLLEAAINWIRVGMPLRTLKIVVRNELQAIEAGQVFRLVRSTQPAVSSSARRTDCEFDVFISYSREDGECADQLVSMLNERAVTLFLDRLQLAEGSAWQPKIFAAIDRCRRFVALYSPSYVRSKVCQEEFNIAWARGRKLERDIIFPIYWQSADLPTYMSMLTYSDCRECLASSLRPTVQRIADACAG